MCCCCLQNKLTHAPHAALKAQPCPREGCTGRVQDTDRVMQTKRKKNLEASLAAPAAIPVPAPKPSGKGRKTHKAPASAEVNSHVCHHMTCSTYCCLSTSLACSFTASSAKQRCCYPRLLMFVCLPSMHLCIGHHRHLACSLLTTSSI